MKQLQTSVHHSFNCQPYNLATFRQQYASVRELPYFNKIMLLRIACVNYVLNCVSYNVSDCFLNVFVYIHLLPASVSGLHGVWEDLLFL